MPFDITFPQMAKKKASAVKVEQAPKKEEKLLPKHSKINGFLRYLSIILIIGFTSFSLVTLTVRSRLTNPEIYKQALDQSGIYELATEVVEDKTTQALITLQREVIARSNLGQVRDDATIIEKTIRPIVASVIEEATTNFVSKMSDRIDLEGVIQSSIEKVIDNDIAWLLGRRQAAEIFELIPPPDQIEAFRETGFDTTVNKERSATLEFDRITSLPICPTVEEVTSNINLVNQGDLAKVTCTNDEITLLLSTSIYNVASNESLWGTGGLMGQVKRLGLKPVVDSIYEISIALANFKQNALILRDLVQQSYETSIFLLLVTLPLLIYVLIVTQKRKLRTFLRVYLATGLVMATFGIIGYLMISNAAINFMPELNFQQEGFLSTAQQVVLSQSFKSVQLYIIRDVSYYVTLIGVVLAVITATPLVIFKVLDRSKYSTKKLD